MSGKFGFRLEARAGAARAGRLLTGRGEIRTPAFMAVGTAAAVKAMAPEEVAATGAEIVLANTYHLMLRPGAGPIERLGGLHKFMNWPKAILTDSGGFQVMSLAPLRELDEAGVTFRSHLDGARHRLTPEGSVELQHRLGADITMVLDECTAFPASEAEARASMARSMRWARRGREAFRPRPGHGLFAIVQGSVYPELRVESAARLVALGFDGYAVGGLAVGEGPEKMLAVLEATVPALPEDRPRYLMGVGKPADLVAAVRLGIDMFDCVLPTRSGRTGQAFTRRGPINLRNARHAEDPRPLDEACRCPACRNYTRAYLHHLVRGREILAAMLLTRHNLTYYQDLMAGLRRAIGEDELEAFAAEFTAAQGQGDIAPLEAG